SITLTPDTVSEGERMTVTIKLDQVVAQGSKMSMGFNAASSFASVKDFTLVSIDGLEQFNLTDVAMTLVFSRSTDTVSFIIEAKDDEDTLPEPLEIRAKYGADGKGKLALAKGTLNPRWEVESIIFTPNTVSEGETTTVTLNLDSALPFSRDVFVALVPGANPQLMIERDDVTLFQNIVGGTFISEDLHGLFGVLRVNPNVRQLTFDILSLADGDVEAEMFKIQANPGSADSMTGQASSSELTIKPAALPTLSFTRSPGDKDGVVGGDPLVLSYGMSLNMGSSISVLQRKTRTEAYLLQRATSALKLDVTLEGVSTANVDGASYCTLTSERGEVPFPLMMKQDYDGANKSVDCATNNVLTLSLPSSGYGWSEVTPNKYSTTLDVIATMNAAVSSKTVDGSEWFGKATAHGTLTASVKME
ncbi:hypothetical protein, partial [Aeromonas salmonicida]|uniref:hypothetical protein n=1 Tax=Aeromonas salmonicida TaxID=645 RepID=UPI003D226316